MNIIIFGLDKEKNDSSSKFRYYKPVINGQTKCTITAQHDSVYIAGCKYLKICFFLINSIQS